MLLLLVYKACIKLVNLGTFSNDLSKFVFQKSTDCTVRHQNTSKTISVNVQGAGFYSK